MTFMLAEDAAIKELFTGLTVPIRNDVDNDPDGEREVPVRWRYPAKEPSDTSYPFITVSMVSAIRATDREHRGFTDMPYLPDEPGWELDPPGENTFVELPIPMDLYYSVEAWSRFARQGQIIFARMLRQNLRLARFGQVEIDADKTVRRVDLLEQSPANIAIDPFNKRLYRAALTLRINSELVPDQIRKLPVQEVVLDGPILL